MRRQPIVSFRPFSLNTNGRRFCRCFRCGFRLPRLPKSYENTHSGSHSLSLHIFLSFHLDRTHTIEYTYTSPFMCVSLYFFQYESLSLCFSFFLPLVFLSRMTNLYSPFMCFPVSFILYESLSCFFLPFVFLSFGRTHSNWHIRTAECSHHGALLFKGVTGLPDNFPIQPWSSLDKEESLACQITYKVNKKLDCFIKLN